MSDKLFKILSILTFIGMLFILFLVLSIFNILMQIGGTYYDILNIISQLNTQIHYPGG
nr:MAG TPA: protein of unknown function (DUF5408) [Caudoviricetes sp.]